VHVILAVTFLAFNPQQGLIAISRVRSDVAILQKLLNSKGALPQTWDLVDAVGNTLRLHPFEIAVRGDDAAAFVERFTPERAPFEGVRTGDVWGNGGAGAFGSMAD
jgi:hypothetical protein